MLWRMCPEILFAQIASSELVVTSENVCPDLLTHKILQGTSYGSKICTTVYMTYDNKPNIVQVLSSYL